MARKTAGPKAAAAARAEDETQVLTPARQAKAVEDSPNPVAPSPNKRARTQVEPIEVDPRLQMDHKKYMQLYQKQRAALRFHDLMDVLDDPNMFFVPKLEAYTDNAVVGTRVMVTFESYQDYAAVIEGIPYWQKAMMSRAAMVVIVVSSQGKRTVIYVRDVRSKHVGGPYPNWEKNVHLIRTKADEVNAECKDIVLPISKEIFRIEGFRKTLEPAMTQIKTNLTIQAENHKTQSIIGTAAVDDDTRHTLCRHRQLTIPVEAITTSKMSSRMLVVEFDMETKYADILEILGAIQLKHNVMCGITSFRGRVLFDRDVTVEDVNGLIPEVYREKVRNVRMQSTRARAPYQGRGELGIEADKSEDPSALLLVTSVHGAVPLEVALSISTGLARELSEEQCGSMKMVKCDGRSALIRAPQELVNKWDNVRVNGTYLLSAFTKILAARKAERAEYEASMARYAETGHGGDHTNNTAARVGGAEPPRANQV